jgi:hypothetical protein
VSKYPLVQAGFGAPQRQRRWKVAIRLILAIPLIIWYFLISIAAGFLIVIGWFCALVLGRLPQSFVQPLTEYVVFITRTNSYLYLMNDAYPPFSAKRDFGVNVEIPNTNIRRWAVLFRIVLIIPAAVVSALVTGGTEVAAVFIWLIVLVKGEMPVSLFAALAAILRYQARFFAYYTMLTSKYPGELFGDEPSSEAATHGVVASPDQPVPVPPLHYDESVAAVSTDETAVSTVIGDAEVPEHGIQLFGAPTGAPVQFDADTSSSVPDVAPRTARLVLSQASKRILVTLLILGVVGNAANTVLRNKLLGNQSALTRLAAANNTLNAQVASAKVVKRVCTLGTTACTQQYFTAIATAFGNFDHTLNGTNFPSSAHADAVRLEATTGKFIALLDQFKSEAGITQAQANHLDTLGNGFDTQLTQVASDLSSPL